MSMHPDSEVLAGLAVSGEAAPAHVAGCARCSAELESFRDLAGRLRAMPEPPEALREAAGAYFVRRRALGALIAALAEDAALRARAARDPAAVLREAGLDADPDLVAALRDAERGTAEAGQRLAARLWF